MIVFLEVTPRWPAASDPIRACSAADRRAQTWDGQKWAAAVYDPGSLAVSLFNGDIGSEVEVSTAPVVLAEKHLLKLFPDAKTVRWEGATFRLWAGKFTSPAGVGSYPYANTVALVAKGKVSRFEKDGGAIKLALDPAGEAGDTNVLALEYAGTGGAEGGPDLKGKLKPWIFGHAMNVEPVLINEDDSVYQFSAYGPIEAVDNLYERGASFGAAVGDYANYAALVAASIPAGRWATCLAEGMIRLGAPQYGVITGDVRGDYSGSVQKRLPGAILQRIATYRGISSDAIDSDSLDALDTFAATLPAGGNINLVLTEQATFLDLARRLAAPFNAQAGFTLLGKLVACRVAISTPTFTIDAAGRRLPVVGTFVESDTPPPYKRIVMSGAVSWRVHDLSNDIAFYATPKERGVYDDAETYREGDIVSIADGSRWIYENPTATAGNDPDDSSVYWERLSAAATGPAGADGVSPPLIKLTSTHQTFRYDTTDTVMTQTTTLKATRQNTAGTTEWRLLAADGTALTSWVTGAAMVSSSGATSSPDNDALVISQTTFNGLLAFFSTTGLIYEARISTATTIQDRVSITKIKDGAAGAPGSAGAPGTNGTNGITYYTWYAYADAPDGTFNFTTGSPGGRFYQGIAYNKTTATESTNPADYAWAPYEGPPNFGLASFNSNTVLAGSKLIKAAGDGNWNASVHSTESFKGGASVSFVVDAGPHSFMVGLNTDPTTDASYLSLDFAIYIAGTTLQVYESGGLSYNVTSFVALNDVFTVTYNGKSVVYSKNGVPFYTNSSPPADLTLFLDTSMSTPAPTYFGRILSFTAVGKPGDDGSDGTDGVDGRSMELAKPVLQILADYDGTIKLGQLPVTCKATFVSGGTDVSATTTWSKTDNNTTSSIGSTGLLTITAVSGNGYVDVSGVYGGTTIVKRVAVEIVKDTAPPQSGTSITTSNIGGNIGTTTMPTAPTSNVVTMGTDASGSLQGVLASRYQVTEAAYSAGRAVTMKGQLFYRLAGSGGAWSTFSGGVVTGGSSGATWTIPDGELNKVEGELNINQSQTGLSANTNYEVGCAIVKDSGSGTALDYIFGTLTVNQL